MSKTIEHFGERLIKRKYSFKLNRDEFALINTHPSFNLSEEIFLKNGLEIENKDNKISYKQEWCEEYRKLCLQNYDLNMKYFNLLDKDEFNEKLDNFLNKHKNFKEVKDLKECEGMEGYYIMVLDEYKQVYIGQSTNIRKRIKHHWVSTLPFDRTLFPWYAVNTSVFSIDFFRPLDTTRIYVVDRMLNYTYEDWLISRIPKKFLINRIGGNVTLAIEAIASQNIRDFSKLQ